MRGSWWVVAAVFFAALALFGLGVEGGGIAFGWVDPVGRIAAQDEALYSHTALRMARTGEWLTPRFLGRLALYKPPALYWFSALSVKLIGPTRTGLRLPSLAAAALVVVLVFWWTRRAAGTPAGLCAAALVLLSPPAHILARLNLTDMLLTACIVAAMAALAADPALRRGRSAVFFGLAGGLAALTKAIAGGLPFLMLGLWRLLASRQQRPGWKRLGLVALVAAAVILPWHLYQLAAHPRWFWAEYIQDEIFFWGTGAPPQTSQEGQAWFYARRLARIDPLLCLLTLAALPWLAAAWRRTAAPQPRLLAAWMVVMSAAILAFSYRNAAYLLPLIPALAILAASYIPLLRGRAGVLAFVVLGALFPLKAHFGERAWGLPFYSGTVPTGRALASYCQLGRANELVIVSPRDEFLSSLLPLAKVRYVFILPGGYRDHRALDFQHLGLVVNVDEFLRLPELEPVYAARLRAWNQAGSAPIATVIVARSEAEVAELVARSPGRDFLIPKSIPASPAHEVMAAAPDRLLLLARGGSPDRSRRPAPGSCESLR